MPLFLSYRELKRYSNNCAYYPKIAQDLLTYNRQRAKKYKIQQIKEILFIC
ncbi:hypothetical protein BTN49_0250 [Candidatus Enterovibrio escicola]|uniref:Uncharacterized protein n=1 Tax=Candidatus Enterovibrio escicola TaxID=1927127 RepID=A0A2A5T7D5_9GAMM|nr:hypothetical protein BTN49_0250 [Candidatus Enterovibrio escacola]